MSKKKKLSIEMAAVRLVDHFPYCRVHPSPARDSLEISGQYKEEQLPSVFEGYPVVGHGLLERDTVYFGKPSAKGLKLVQ